MYTFEEILERVVRNAVAKADNAMTNAVRGCDLPGLDNLIAGCGVPSYSVNQKENIRRHYVDCALDKFATALVDLSAADYQTVCGVLNKNSDGHAFNDPGVYAPPLPTQEEWTRLVLLYKQHPWKAGMRLLELLTECAGRIP